MTGEPNAEEVVNFAFQPVRAGPDRHQGIDHRILPGQTHTQAQFRALWNGNQMVIQFKARLVRVAIKAGRIGEKIALQLVATALGSGPEQLARHDDRRFAAILDYFRNAIRVPRPQVFCRKQVSADDTSVLVGILRQFFLIPKRRLVMPVQRALFPKIKVTDQQDADIHHHLCEAVPA